MKSRHKFQLATGTGHASAAFLRSSCGKFFRNRQLTIALIAFAFLISAGKAHAQLRATVNCPSPSQGICTKEIETEFLAPRLHISEKGGCVGALEHEFAKEIAEFRAVCPYKVTTLPQNWFRMRVANCSLINIRQGSLEARTFYMKIIAKFTLSCRKREGQPDPR